MERGLSLHDTASIPTSVLFLENTPEHSPQQHLPICGANLKKLGPLGLEEFQIPLTPGDQSIPNFPTAVIPNKVPREGGPARCGAGERTESQPRVAIYVPATTLVGVSDPGGGKGHQAFGKGRG